MRSALVNLASQPIRNLHRNPGAASAANFFDQFSAWQGSTGNAISPQTQVAAPWAASGKAFRATWTARTVASGDTGMSLTGATDTVAQIAGRRATAVFDLVCSVGGWSLPTPFMTVSNLTPSATATVHASAPGQPVTAGVPVRCWVTFTVPAGTTSITSLRANLSAMPLTAPITVDVSNADLYLGDYDPKRLPGNGDLPGWKWAGGAWGSESVGYPYTLESIAGRPLASNITLTAPTSAIGVSVPDLPPLQGRTLYSVYDVTDTNTAYVSPVAYREPSGSTATYGRVNFQTGNASVDAFGSRVDLAGGSSNATLSRTGLGARTVGRHVASVALPDGLTAQTLRMDNIATATLPLAPGSGLAFPAGTAQLWNLVAPSTPPVASYLYAGEHNEQTARRIMAWLARQYGAPIPAGY